MIPVRVQAWVAGLIPSSECARGSQLMILTIVVSISLSEINKNIKNKIPLELDLDI